MNTPYDDGFYLKQREVSARSAECVVPLILSLAPVRSVVDVGCGVGTWAASFLKRGVDDVVAIDGDYVNRQLLRIPANYFQTYDLRQPIRMDRGFDLAVCLEVAEHLPAARAASFVEDLCGLAPVILFSAAVPGQGGTDHINEQYLSYWTDLFSGHGYVVLDALRPKIWNDQEVDWVYRQNAVLFAHHTNPLISRLQVTSGVDYVHPYLLDTVVGKLTQPTLGYLLRSLPGSVGRSLRSRFRRLFPR